METGDEAMVCLIAFAVEHDVSAASFKAIGAGLMLISLDG